MSGFMPFRLWQALCSCHDFLWHPTPKFSQLTLMPHCIYKTEEAFFFFSARNSSCTFYCDLKICCFMQEHFHFSIFALSCFGWRWGGINKSAYLSLTDMFPSDGFYLAHAYYIIHNGNLIIKWMNATIHSKQMHIKWQSLSNCLLYDKEISTKLAFIWHSYISQFAKDSYPLVPTVSSYFYCTDCCCHDVLPWFCCCCCFFY